jgi:NCS1 family nucleobase:cation symporter-1
MLRPKGRTQTLLRSSLNDINQHSLRQYIQLIIIPVGFTLASFIGIAVTSAGIALYGQILWDPLKLIDHWDNRAAAFFASFSFALATLGTNISANSLSAGNDMTALWPRYINIRRGQVICAILGGWALCPWEILARCVRLRKNSGSSFPP